MDPIRARIPTVVIALKRADGYSFALLGCSVLEWSWNDRVN